MIPIAEILKLSIQSLLRNKTRSLLTMLGIIIGVASVILLVSLGQGLQGFITGQFEKLGTNIIFVLPGKIGGEGGLSQSSFSLSTSKLTLKQANGLAKLGGPIEAVGAGNELPSAIKYKGKSKVGTIIGGTGNYPRVFNLETLIGRNINESDVALSRKVVVLGKDIVEKLFGQGNPVGKEVSIGNQKFLVIGTLKDMGSAGVGPSANDHSVIPITSAQKLFGVNYVQAISVKARSQADIPAAKKLAQNYLNKYLNSDDFSVVDSSSLLSTINQILGVLTAALGGIAAISLVVGGVGIMNIMLVSVTERTHEIGLRKAVGASPGDILIQFVIESVVLSVFGGALGIIIGAGGAFIMNKFFPASVSFWSISLAFGVSAIVGIIFGVAPAIKASRLNPIDALRYE